MALFLRPPRVVVFDFNGTLFDDLRVAYGSVQEIFRAYNLPCPTLEQYREEITSDYMAFYYNYGIPRATADHKLNAIRNKYYQENGESAQIRSDVRRTVESLFSDRINLAIVSAESSTNLYRQLIRSGNLQRCFDVIKAESWGVKGKEQAFFQVAEIFNENPDRIVYVDDSVDGLNSAKNAGVTPVAFTNPTGYHSASRLNAVTEFHIYQIKELVHLINPKRWLI